MASFRENLAAIHWVGSKPEAVILLTFEYGEEEDVWVGECIELGTVAQARKLEQLRKEVAEAVLLQLNQMEELGFVEAFLNEHNVERVPIAGEGERSKSGPPWSLPQLVGA